MFLILWIALGPGPFVILAFAAVIQDVRYRNAIKRLNAINSPELAEFKLHVHRTMRRFYLAVALSAMSGVLVTGLAALVYSLG